jgi:hypothetical protein
LCFTTQNRAAVLKAIGNDKSLSDEKKKVITEAINAGNHVNLITPNLLFLW